jgi:glucokinase
LLHVDDLTDGTATVEGVVSGPGLANVFEFLHTVETTSLTDTETMITELSREDQPAAIAAAALTGEPTAVKAVDVMLTAFGAELRQVALRCMPDGGLYIAGGIAPKLRDRMHTLVTSYTQGDFLMQELISSFPLYLVTNDDLGLLGSRVRAQRCLSQ